MVSAQQSRLKKKEEVYTLNKIITDKDEKLSRFVEKILANRLGNQPELVEAIRNDIESEWPTMQAPSQKTPAASSTKQKSAIMSSFYDVFNETFLTKEEELAKFRPNDEKDSDEEIE